MKYRIINKTRLGALWFCLYTYENWEWVSFTKDEGRALVFVHIMDADNAFCYLNEYENILISSGKYEAVNYLKPDYQIVASQE